VSPKNAGDLAKKEDIDGFLVGGASLKVGSPEVHILVGLFVSQKATWRCVRMLCLFVLALSMNKLVSTLSDALACTYRDPILRPFATLCHSRPAQLYCR
jgi:hypothetical protein